MFGFLKKWKEKKERDKLYDRIQWFVHVNWEKSPQFSLANLPAKLDDVPQEKQNPSTGDRSKNEENGGLAEEGSLPRIVMRNGQAELVGGSSEAPTFANEVKRLMREKGLSSTEICQRVLLDRRLWSKLNTDSQYQPSRETAYAICIALHLREQQAQALLATAGFALSNTREQDVVMRYFLLHGMYNIDLINDMLSRFGMKCFGTNVRE